MPGLTAEQLEQFDQDGYLVVEDVLGEADLAAIEQEYREILDRVTADLVSQGRIPPPRGTNFSERYIEAMQHMDDMYTLYQHLDICLPMVKELDHSHTMNTRSAVFDLLTNPRLLDIAESVVGPEIYSNPVQHTRIKPPARTFRPPSPTPTSPPRNGTRTAGSSTPRPTAPTCSPSGSPSPMPPSRTGA